MRVSALLTLAALPAAACLSMVPGGIVPKTRHTMRAAVKAGLFDGFFSDPGRQTACPPGYAKASHILLKGEDSVAAAEELKSRIESGEVAFEEAAKELSACPSKGKGGDLGVFSGLGKMAFLPYEGQKVEPFDALVFSPETTLDVLHVVETKFGAHVVKVTGRGR